MLTIRDEQMQAFELDRIHEYQEKLLRHLREVAPECAEPEKQIERGMAEGPEFGLSSEKDVARFVEITCVFLGGFPAGRLPKTALAILMTYGGETAVKLKRYEEWARRNGRIIQ
jgi:hypothetical protein